MSCGPRITYKQFGGLQIQSNAVIGRLGCVSSVGTMPDRSKRKRKTKNREKEEKVASIFSVVTRSKDKKDKDELALAVVKSRMEQLLFDKLKEAEEKLINATLMRCSEKDTSMSESRILWRCLHQEDLPTYLHHPWHSSLSRCLRRRGLQG
jgi:hypothetical protein